MWHIIYILLLAVTAILPLDAQVPKDIRRGLTREQIDSLVHPTVAPEGKQMLRFEATSHELGTLSEDDAPVNRTFTYRNVSGRPVTISRVRTNCGCTAARHDSLPLAPDGTAQITLTYNPKNRPGTIDVDAFVYVEGIDRQPIARLSLYGEVIDSDVWSHLPHAMGHLRIKRKEASFTEVPVGGNPSIRIPCANSGDAPLRLSARLLPSYATFRTEPAVIAPGAEADIVVSIDASRLPAREGKLQFSILVEGIAGRPSERTLHVTVE